MGKEPQKLTDPVGKDTAQQEAGQAKKDEQLLSVSIKDLKGIEPSAARTAGIFEGYPFKHFDQPLFDQNGKPKMKDGKPETIRFCSAFVVALKGGEPVYQDPSGFGYTPGDKPAANVRPINLKTFHSRCIFDHAEKKNFDVVFDRTIVLPDGKIEQCALVPSHNVRAQIVYKIIPKTGKAEVDNRYYLLDAQQAKRLRRIFGNIMLRNKKQEASVNLITEDGGGRSPEQETQAMMQLPTTVQAA